MLTKLQFLHSAIAIAISFCTLASQLGNVRANPALSAGEKKLSDPQLVPDNTLKTAPDERNSLSVKRIEVNTISGEAETELVAHLVANGAEFYGAYWCNHCQKQKSLFGATAAAKLIYIECAADGENSQRQLCKEKDIKYFPTWVINGKYYTGTKDLKELAKMTDYQGLMNFKYRK